MERFGHQLRIVWDEVPVRLTPVERVEVVELLGQLMLRASMSMDTAKENDNVGIDGCEDHG